ncbi:hypothetical protein ACP70R_032419 [Stipagrostis hirtigluma subsp. patula]
MRFRSLAGRRIEMSGAAGGAASREGYRPGRGGVSGGWRRRRREMQNAARATGSEGLLVPQEKCGLQLWAVERKSRTAGLCSHSASQPLNQLPNGPNKGAKIHLGSSDSQKTMMVEKGCDSCRKWQDHYYWEHMDANKIRFFKLMTGDFAQGISIPEKFVKNFNGQITKGVHLKVPSGETWQVSVTKNANELFLMSGWEDFVKAHELEENDLLIFTCSGNSSFEVLVFEAGGCEKVSSLFGNKTGPNMRKCFFNMSGRGQQAEHYSLSDTDDTTTPSHLVASTSKKSSCKTKPRKQLESPNSSDNDVKHEATSEENSDDEYADSKYYYARTADRLSYDEKKEIISMVSIQPDNPVFVTVLQKSHVRSRSKFLIFPSRFAADHLESRLHEITLRRPNKKDTWCVKYYRTNDTRGIKNYLFSKFVTENKLREGDICVFELMKGARRVTMTVHIIRKVDGQFLLVG